METPQTYSSDFLELTYRDWLAQMANQWRQGEHVALLGMTGSGKTYTARDLLRIRGYVVVLAVKKQDDTLQLFTKGDPPYKLTKRWPVNYDVTHAVLALPPENLADTSQAYKVYRVLDDVFRNGGWCILLDDTGYITGYLRLRRQVTQLLNTGRSHGISVVTAATQPTSVAANIPSETLRQVRHILMWRYASRRDIDALADITGLDKSDIRAAMARLTIYPDASTDFLVYHIGRGLTIVRQDRAQDRAITAGGAST